MAYQVTFAKDDQIIYLRLIGEVTQEEVYGFNRQLTQILRQSNQIVHVLIDASSLTQYPGNLQSLRRMMTYLHEPTLGWVIDWGNTNTNFYFITSVLNQMARVSCASCTTLLEAIQRLDTTLRKRSDQRKKLIISRLTLSET
ncbi:MAG: hypothetical protein H7Y09_01595 [Chitinophagaceae bacterium]|nr:hypothetical protein [Anaerolineae bacterium]